MNIYQETGQRARARRATTELRASTSTSILSSVSVGMATSGSLVLKGIASGYLDYLDIFKLIHQ